MLEHLNFDNSFDKLGSDFATRVNPRPLVNPKLVCVDSNTCELLGISKDNVCSENGVNMFSGNKVPPQFAPLAMVYAGHQFGGYSSQLGDGRGLLLGELNTHSGKYDLHLKGAGKTPYSRFGDGYAVLRSCIREYLAGIAMRGLGIPTSHALCIVRGDNAVTRETIEPAATLTRVARSHIRFGSFEYFYYTQQHTQLEQLADYAVEQYIPEYAGKDGRFNALLHYTTEQTAKLIAAWQAVGFCHGVMNTDNMSIIGETLDYGPYGFMEAYNPTHICNHSDTYGRYAYDQQPSIGLWNLNALAAALSPLINRDQARASLESYEGMLTKEYNSRMAKKLGFLFAKQGDAKLINAMFIQLEQLQLDYTLFFRQLALAKADDLQSSFIQPLLGCNNIAKGEQLAAWAAEYLTRRQVEDVPQATITADMNSHNPIYCLRNYFAQQAIDEAYQQGTYSTLEKLAVVLADPFTSHPNASEFETPPPSKLANIAVSCSS
ncbi:protein adenylyltransferase SelO [Saccharophagus degradans]|uniref:Protein nucleotidyltransferase YdiU n=1 Tax=Saccharophagus degradans TaxID=86304 RepID=A0AAW7XD87_9GAMM|nr:YdiU family protein [Saccharophagus degradans]MDO6424807.1 YdiU family protein [Saccharophagus degradans]MDO6609691.1 YdiU family protein [Saccharophagus degradans]